MKGSTGETIAIMVLIMLGLIVFFVSFQKVADNTLSSGSNIQNKDSATKLRNAIKIVCPETKKDQRSKPVNIKTIGGGEIIVEYLPSQDKTVLRLTETKKDQKWSLPCNMKNKDSNQVKLAGTKTVEVSKAGKKGNKFELEVQ